MASNDRVGISVKQPTEFAERSQVAHRCSSALEITMPMVVDEIDDRVGKAYSGMPDRLYVLDAQGRVAFKSGRGPFGFKPGEMEQTLIQVLLEPQGPTVGRVPVLDQEEAWRRLPKAAEGDRLPLPGWARALAGPLPQTTAAMLELDYLHRVKSPLDPKLRAMLRFVVAHANRSPLAGGIAATDLLRLGVRQNDLQAIVEFEQADFPEAEKAALAFARKLTLDQGDVTDAEVAKLIQLYGDKDVAAMVLLVAYANFQDRIFLGLNLAPAAAGPNAPVAVKFARGPVTAAARPPQPEPPPGAAVPTTVADPEWRALDFAALQAGMKGQKERPGRIRVPTWDEVKGRLPPGAAARPVRIRWSLVCLGYQPELTQAWFNCTWAFGQEARQSRAFEEELFWVVTRTVHCFY